MEGKQLNSKQHPFSLLDVPLVNDPGLAAMVNNALSGLQSTARMQPHPSMPAKYTVHHSMQNTETCLLVTVIYNWSSLNQNLCLILKINWATLY